jgi:cytochrome c oxidase cbb3-type subunit I/II
MPLHILLHFTDWIVAHVHIGALGWNGFLTFGMLYWLVPKLWRTDLYSKKLANAHFWIGTLGIVFYASSMYWSGVAQSLMWKQFSDLGVLQYPNFLETVLQIIPMYMIRAFGGTLFLVGMLVMVYNLIKTMMMGSFVKDEEAESMPLEKKADSFITGKRHRWLEGKPVLFLVLTLVVILIGGIVEFLPTFLIKSNIPTIAAVQPYTPLELQGRDLYIREGCVGCHSQLIRPFRSETERYGEYSKAGEFVYDHPFLWGSKRTGPDLHRVGGKYPNLWHYLHMENPESMSPGSIMPQYPWLLTNDLDISTTKRKIEVMMGFGVPYPEGYEEIANSDLVAQAEEIALDLQETGIPAEPNKEIIALIAYLQRLGTDIKVNN